MREKSFQLGSSPRLSFRACAGDLRIQSWEQEEVQILFRREGEAANVQEAEGELTLDGVMPKAVQVPPGASVHLQRCSGDFDAANVAVVHIEAHQGDLSLNQVNKVELAMVHGDVQVREAQSLQVTTLHGDLRVQNLAESAAIAQVHGDITLKQTQGQLTLENVTGDVVVRNPAAHLDVRNVTGDLTLSGDVQAGEYHLEALGDVSLYLGTESNANLELEARLGRITCGLKLDDSSESANRVTGKIGQGAAHLEAVSNTGDVRLRPLGTDQVRREMEKERIWVEVHARRAEEHARRVAERELLRAEAHARRSAAHAQRMAEKAHRAQERLAEKAEERATRMKRLQVKLGMLQRGPSPEALENERLAILKMLAEGKISAEQAESLLDALEG